MSDCQSFQGKLQPISQNSNFGKNYYFAKCVVSGEMSDCQSFQGIIQPISQNSNFGKITILRNALFQLK